MPELQLERLAPDGVAKKLVPEADTEHGALAQEFANRLNDRPQPRGVAGARRQQEPRRLVGQDLVRRGPRWEDEWRTALSIEAAQYVVLQATVEDGESDSPSLVGSPASIRPSDPHL